MSALAAVGVLYLPIVARGQTDPCQCDRQVCTPDGFQKSLTTFSVDALNGTSSWTYQLCVPAADGTCSNDSTKSCQDNQDCWGNRCQTGGPNAGTCSQDDTTACTADTDCNGGVTCSGACRVDKFKDLSHVDVLLPDVGTCLSEAQSISVGQICNPTCAAVLECSVSDKDPSCPSEACAPGTGVPGIPCQPIGSKVLKCNVAEGSNIDPGECVTIQVTIAGEVPTLGPGGVDELTKVGTTCTRDAICGPACGCQQDTNRCLTRTAGFWGTHPAVTALFDPITVCGKTLDTTNAGVCNSDTEALCISPGTESNKTCDKNPAYQQLVRQLAAAKLNINASAANGGNCGQGILDTIATCELLCRTSQSRISSSGCIQALDAFNNSQDTFPVTPSPFDKPGPADPTQCQAASGNGRVIGKFCSGIDCR